MLMAMAFIADAWYFGAGGLAMKQGIFFER